MSGTSQVAAIFDAHFEYVWRSLMRLGASATDAEDLAQEVFVVVHQRLGTYDTARPIKPWLFGVARNVVRDHRKLARNARETPDDEIEPGGSDPGYRAFEAKTELYVALAALSEPLRALLVLHDVDEVPMQEVADVLSIPIDTAYSRLRRGRELLRQALREMQGSPS